MRVATPEAYKLFHDGTLALANVEANGMRVDVAYLDKAIRRAERKTAELEESLKQDDVFRVWRKHFAGKTKLTSGEQLAHVLFTILKHPCREFTDMGKPSATDANLQDIDLDFVRNWRRLAKYQKVRGTFLEGIRNFTTSDGLIHPNFNLNLVATYRSSSNDPNFQNFPARDEEMAKLVRRSFIPRDNHRLVECDFSGIEVGIACAYNKDQNLIHDYTVGDMHRDMAMKCFCLEKEEVSKQTRYCSKNMFVFPQFYGSYYVECSRNLWEAIDRFKLQTVSGIPLREHLKAHGIKACGDCDPESNPKKGTFEKHVQEIENEFWNERYPTYTAWKKQTWQEYQNRGWTRLLTGFVCTRNSDAMPLNRKQTINYRIQGTAFHCLLWSLIEMNRWLLQHKMRSVIVSQIHDSILMDVHEDEMDDVLAKANELMSVKLPATWTWINVPLRAETEACEVGETWFDKKKIEI